MTNVLLIGCLLLLQESTAPPEGSGEAVPSVAEVLEHLKAARAQIQNAKLVVRWETLSSDVPESWEHQTFYADALGRRRIIYEHGRLTEEGTPVQVEDPRKNDILFDGEIVLDKAFFPQRNRNGRNAKPDPTAARSDLGYRAVIIADAAAPLKSTITGHRNPLEYLTNLAIRELDRATRDNQGAVTRTPDGRYDVSFKKPDDSDVPFVRSVIRVDPGRGWLVEKLESFAEDDRLVRQVSYEYQDHGDGTWTPLHGSHRHWGDRSQDKPPYFEWKFTVEEARYNDPGFDEHIFDVLIEPGAAVSDTRYDVAYDIGTEQAVAGDLVELARQAQLEPVAAKGPVPSSSGRRLLIVVNACVIAAIAGILLWRKVFKRA